MTKPVATRCPRCGALWCHCEPEEQPTEPIVDIPDDPPPETTWQPVHTVEDMVFRPTYAALVGELARYRAALRSISNLAEEAQAGALRGHRSYADLSHALAMCWTSAAGALR